MRPRPVVVLPGGKGVNAARAAARLGGSVMTSGISGGHAGRWIVAALASEGLDPRWSAAEAETRTTYVIVDERGESVLVYEPAAPVTDAEYAAFLELLEDDLLHRCGRAIVAGSLPGGVSVSALAEVVEVCRRAERPLLVDASGAALLAALEASPDIVKIGRVEAVETGVVEADASAMDAAVALAERGARLAVVTDGAAEVAATDRISAWRLNVPPVEAVNAVGSGDAFNAALSLALLEGADIPTALRKGVAAGSANALSLGAAMLDAEAAHDLEQLITATTTTR